MNPAAVAGPLAISGDAVARAVESLANWAWRASWQGAVLALLVAVIVRCVGRRISPAWRFGLWGMVLVRMAAPPVVAVTWGSAPARTIQNTPVAVVPEVWTAEGEEIVHPTVTEADWRVTLARPQAADELPVVRSAWDWTRVRAWAMWGWFGGMVLLAGRVAGSSMGLARGVRRAATITDRRVLDVLDACCRETGIRRAPAARLLSGSGGPALVGYWRPVILLPRGVLDAMSDGELRLILLHELAHVRRRDVLVNWIGTLIAVVHWPNPAVWRVLERMRFERELACDEAVLRAGRGAGGPTAYARTIVKLAEALSAAAAAAAAPARGGRGPAGAVGIIEGKSQLHRRLQMIARFDSDVRRWPVVAAGLGIMVGGLALSGVTRAQDRPDDAGAAPTAKVTEKPGQPAAQPGGGDLPEAKKAPARPGGAADLIDALLEPRRAPAAAPPPVDVPTDPASARTAEKLRKAVSVQFQGQALADVLDFIRDAAKIDIVVQWRELEATGIDRNAPVTLSLREPTPVGDVLSLAFRTIAPGLRFEIDKGAVVVVSDRDRPALATRVYDVSDLATATQEAVPPGANPATGPGAAGDVSQLIKLIQDTVQPDTWRDAGGSIGSIRYFKNKLVVKSTDQVHKEIDQLLDMLREQSPTKPQAKQPKR